MNMSSSHHIYPFIFILSFISMPIIIMAFPALAPENPYDSFMEFLSKNNCTMPKEIILPFAQTTQSKPFSYLSKPLEECRTLDAVKDNDEASLLCKEVFEVLQNITCNDYIEPIPVIDSGNLSTDVCGDFKAMKEVFPQRSDYLSGKLSDAILCKILCTTSKYESLCKTLLWTYNTLTRIKNALGNTVPESEKEDGHGVSPDKSPSSIKVSLDTEGNELKNQVSGVTNEPEKVSNNNIHPEHKDESASSNSNLSTSKSKVSDADILSQNASDKINSFNSEIHDESINQTTVSVKTAITPKTETAIKQQQVSQEVGDDKNTKSGESSSQNNLQEQIDHDENKINVDEQTKKGKGIGKVTEVSFGAKNLTSKYTGIKANQNDKNVTESVLQAKPNDQVNINSEAGKKTTSKSAETESQNLELNNAASEENESSINQVELKTQKDNEVEKPNQTNFEGENEPLPDIDTKLAEPSTLQMVDDDGEPHQDKDQDQYNDTENDADYPKAEYENSFNDVSKAKVSIKNSGVVGSDQMASNYETYNNPRNNIGREIPFPEQEDSHFFFYFLSIVFIVMAGYLVFHNKQKIIALIVEGRHERRRRSHGAGYKKLETK